MCALLLWATTAVGCDASHGLSSSLAAAGVAGPGALEAPRVALPPLPPLTGDRLIYRFCDHAGEATLDLGEPGQISSASDGKRSPPAGLRDRFLGFDSPYKMASPYSGLRGETALRVIEVAIAEPAVEKYPRPPETTAASSSGSDSAPRFDPVWNRYRGVYESKVALFAPAPACYRYRLPLPPRGLLSFHYAAIPPQKTSDGRTLPVEFSVNLDGKRLWSAQVGKSKAGAGTSNAPAPAAAPTAGTPTAPGTSPPGHWLAGSIELPAAGKNPAPSQPHEVAFCSTLVRPDSGSDKSGSSRGEPGSAGTAVWGNPELWSLDEGAAGPNVLLVLVDTLRADALSAMPGLSQYGRSSVAFTQAITAATWTRPSLLGLLGGELATAVGQSAEEMIPSDRERKRFYALDRRLLPRALRGAGYKVASIGNNFFLLGYPQIGLSLGFDEVADVRHPVEDTPAISRAAIAFLQSQASRGRSFFLQLHYDAPHWPYTPPPEHQKGITDAQVAQLMGLSESERAGARLDPQARAYLGEAAYADAQIGLVLAELERLKLRDRTLVIVVGDHGEVFDPRHNHYVQSLKQPTLYHHGWSAYDEILRVPLVLSMPGRLPGGTVVNSQVRLTDVAPTVLELLGLGSYRAVLPSGGRGDGQSLLPLIFSPSGPSGPGGSGQAAAAPSRPLDDRSAALGDEDKLGRPAYAEGQNIRALRYAGYLYLRRGDARLQRAQGNDGVGPVLRVAEELYDLKADPYQHNDLLAAFYSPGKSPPRDGQSGPGSAPSKSDPLADPLADPRVGPILGRLREEFSRHTPQSPEQGLPLVHIMLAPDTRAAHLLTGTLVSSDLGLSVQGVRNGEVVPRGPGRIELRLRPGGVVDILVDPSAKLELSLARDGLSVTARELLLGPFSLPLLSGRSDGKLATSGATAGVPAGATAGATAGAENTAGSAPVVLDGPLLDRLSSSYAPVPGERGEILIWRDQTAPGLAAASTSQGGGAATPASGAAGAAKGAGEVETLMRDWGYARPAAPTAPAAVPAAPKTGSPADGGP
jgi:arylsulfatase A-like enzyme